MRNQGSYGEAVLRARRPLLAFAAALAGFALVTAGTAWFVTRAAVNVTAGVTLDDLRHGDRLDRLVDEIAAIDGVMAVYAAQEQSSPYLRITLDPERPRGTLRAVGDACARAREAWDPGTQPVIGKRFALTCRVVDESAS
jgi:hypothetical protein